MRHQSKFWNTPPAWRPRLCCCLALLLFALPARAETSPDVGLETEPEVSITDDRGQEVRLAAPARRIVPLYGGLTDILLALGLEQRIIARTEADLAPALRLLPSVGTHMRPNPELLVGLGPDLALQMGGRKEAMLPLQMAEAQGIATAFFQANDFPSLFSVIQRIGTLAGVQDRAGELIADMQRRLDAVARKVAAAPRPAVFFEVRYPNLLAAGRRNMVTAVIDAAGGHNCLHNKEKLVRLNEEALLALDPEVCLIQDGPMNPAPTPLAERDHFRTLRCVQAGRTAVVGEKLFSRPGPGSVLAVEQLAALLHPGVFASSLASSEDGEQRTAESQP